jgi:hypothetical protein
MEICHMSKTDPQTVAALRRKVERLDAQIETLKEKLAHAMKVSGDTMWVSIDRKTRIEQAMRILNGEES